MHLLGASTHVSAMAKFKGTHTLMHVLKSGEKEDNETFVRHIRINFQHWFTKGIKHCFSCINVCQVPREAPPSGHGKR